MSIEDNIAARKAADEAFELMSLAISEQSLSPEAAAKAWRSIGDRIDAVTQTEREPVESPNVMSDQEAKRFERSIVSFGKHKGKAIKDVPLDYLLWVDGDEFRGDLRRYLKREDVQREQEREQEREAV